MERGDRDAAVGQRAHVRGRAELAVHRVLDRLLDRGADLLHDRGQHDRGVVGVGLVPVGVNANDPSVTVRLGGRRRAQADRARDGHDDVRALRDELLGLLLAQRLIVEGLREGAVLRGLVPAEQLHVRTFGLVVGRDAVSEAIHEHRHRGDLDTAEGGDLAGLGHARGHVAGQVGGLSRVEQQRTRVVQRHRVVVTVVEAGVDEGVVHILVLLGGGVDGLLQVEADADDQVAAVGHHGLHIRVEVRVRVGLGRVDLDAEAGLGGLEAVVGGLVERLVIPAASVRDRAGLERGGTLRSAGLAGGGSSTAATAGQGERCDSRRSEELREVLHECFPPSMWILP